jgi:hypothetical protein
MKILSLTLTFVLLLVSQCLAETSQDAYITTHGTEWTLGSASVEMTIALRNGMLVTTGFKNKANGHELAPSDSTGPWTLVDARTSKLKQGEFQLDLTLRQEGLAETKSYVVYPGSSVIRQWAELKNVGSVPLKVSDPEFLNFSARLGDPASVDFDWMTGGDNAHGSWVLKTEKLIADKPRNFDSNYPFPDRELCGTGRRPARRLGAVERQTDLAVTRADGGAKCHTSRAPRCGDPGTEGRPSYFSGDPDRASAHERHCATLTPSTSTPPSATATARPTSHRRSSPPRRVRTGGVISLRNKENTPTWCWMKATMNGT